MGLRPVYEDADADLVVENAPQGVGGLAAGLRFKVPSETVVEACERKSAIPRTVIPEFAHEDLDADRVVDLRDALTEWLRVVGRDR